MDGLNLNVVDIFILTVMLLAGLIAFVRGFVKEVLGVGSWIGATIITILMIRHVQPIAYDLLESELASYLVAGGGLFFGSLVILWTITHILSTRVQSSAIGALDRTLGFIVGLVKGAFYVTLMFVAMSWLVPGWTDRDWAKESRLLPFAAVGAGWISDAIADRTKSEGEGSLDEVMESGKGYGEAARQGIERLIEESTQNSE